MKELEARLREAQSSRALTESNFRAVAREFEELQLAIKLKQVRLWCCEISRGLKLGVCFAEA